uniref:helix-turn-helix transcriptional regulator n=1 Tax=Yoonia sp. TaxID=2212373 RepID=UPI004047F8A8
MVHVMPNTQSDQFFDTAQASHHLGYSKSTLEWWRTEGRGPRFYKMSGRVRYRISDLNDWMESGLVETRG